MSSQSSPIAVISIRLHFTAPSSTSLAHTPSHATTLTLTLPLPRIGMRRVHLHELLLQDSLQAVLVLRHLPIHESMPGWRARRIASRRTLLMLLAPPTGVVHGLRKANGLHPRWLASWRIFQVCYRIGNGFCLGFWLSEACSTSVLSYSVRKPFSKKSFSDKLVNLDNVGFCMMKVRQVAPHLRAASASPGWCDWHGDSGPTDRTRVWASCQPPPPPDP